MEMMDTQEYRRRIVEYLEQERERREYLSGDAKRRCTIAIKTAQKTLDNLENADGTAEGDHREH